ncbi:HsdM family class I SAM-dependent methyltransferase [Mycoplasma leonicaptivi]|uniref:HsdM family class I SAM-dependent methyltransferase n=1 Tax=Mycoplasma leonicaptivi TaxID=36742 RepID=UPI000B1F5B18|nr:N-6 DNA methylase [Mycoplasma leonicaptivi]
MQITKKMVKTSGVVYTPSFIVNNILDIIKYNDHNILNKHIIDNSCGDGAFLVEIVSRYIKIFLINNNNKKELKNHLETYIHGIEINANAYNKCIKQLDELVKNFNIENVNWNILNKNTLDVEIFNQKMDFVVGNPPYVRIHNFEKEYNKIKNFSFAKKGMSDLYIVFFEIGINMLNPNGKLCYITPSSYFNSLASQEMRQYFCENKLIKKIVDLKHFQAFNATTYTAITLLDKNNTENFIKYFEYDDKVFEPKFIDFLKIDDFYINKSFYFNKKSKLINLKEILNNNKMDKVEVKNGLATLCDKVFIQDFKINSDFILPIIKASRAKYTKIFYPYDENGILINIDEIKKDSEIFNYLLKNKDLLLNRDIKMLKKDEWYAFGRTQGILDTYKTKIAINNLLKIEGDLKIIDCPAGVAVYSGLYIIF